MRYFFAILSLVIAAVLIVLGIGQRTFLAGPSAVREDLPVTSADSQYLVVPAETFTLHKGNPSVILHGEDVFFSFAHDRDVLGWVEPFAYETIAVDGEGEGLTGQAVEPPQPEARDVDGDGEDVEESRGEEAPESDDSVATIDPRGSDLWLAEYEGDTSLKVAVSLEDDQSVLITSGEGDRLPTEAYILWAQERHTPLAGPLLLTGTLFGALGAVLYLFALDHDRRGLGPRRGRRGPFQGLRNPRTKRDTKPRVPSGARRGSRLGFGVIGMSLALVVTGCSPSYWPQPGPEPEPEPTAEAETSGAVVPVTEQQMQRILQDVVETVNAGDEARDASLLDERVTGPAYDQRAANYRIVEQTDDWRPLPHLTDARLSYDLVQSTEKWPRTLFITVESSDELPQEEAEEEDTGPETTDSGEGDASAAETADPQPEEESTPTLALILTQASPHENYKLSHIIELRGGIQMPAAAPVEEGTAVLANDIKTLQHTPKETAEIFATILEEGTDAVEAENFNVADEHLVQNMGGQWAAQNCSSGLSCSAEVAVDESPIITLSTGQGGALVLATFTDAHIMQVTGERNVISLTKVEEALGLEGSHRTVRRIWQHDVLFYVPNADTPGMIKILGSSSEIVGATAE